MKTILRAVPHFLCLAVAVTALVYAHSAKVAANQRSAFNAHPVFAATTTPAPATRTISVGSGLTGGGDLSADRTISVDTTLVPVSGQNALTGSTSWNNHSITNLFGIQPLASNTLFIEGNQPGAAGSSAADVELLSSVDRTTGDLLDINNFTSPVAQFDTSGDLTILGGHVGNNFVKFMNSSGVVEAAGSNAYLYVAGDRNATDTTSPDVFIGSLKTRTAGELSWFYNNGTKEAYVKFDGKFGVITANTATTATAGANGAVPAQVAGYILFDVNGTTQKVPYFNN